MTDANCIFCRIAKGEIRALQAAAKELSFRMGNSFA